MRILVAGIGNIFFGDDAFGVEVLRALSQRALPPEVAIRDFGIRGYDLAYALTEGDEAVILIDAVPRGESPGTVYLIEPDLEKLGPCEQASVDPHSLNPIAVLQMARQLGSIPPLYLIGCEPGSLNGDERCMGLSDAVQAAVPKAVELIESLLERLLKAETNKESCAMQA